MDRSTAVVTGVLLTPEFDTLITEIVDDIRARSTTHTSDSMTIELHELRAVLIKWLVTETP